MMQVSNNLITSAENAARTLLRDGVHEMEIEDAKGFFISIHEELPDKAVHIATVRVDQKEFKIFIRE